MMLVIVKIYDGADYSSPVLRQYQATGELEDLDEQIREVARVKCGRLREGQLTWVDVFSPEGEVLRHWTFRETLE